jgi:hypothetical protein
MKSQTHLGETNMKHTILAIALSVAATSSFADDAFDYTKVKGTDAATYNALNQETTRLNTYTYGNSVAIQNLSGRADDTDLALIGQNSRNDVQDTRLNGHDAQFAQQDTINDALSSKLNGLYTDTAGLRSEVRQARREAKEAKAGAAAALAVAGQNMCTLKECGAQVALSGSTMSGYQAVALGAGAAINDHWFVNGAFTQSGSVRGGVISTTYSFR